jgi:DNA-binding CsgD family transcriptional regulator
MTAPLVARERDLRTLAGIVSAYRGDLPAQGLPWSLLSELKEQIDCDEIAFEGFDSGRRMAVFTQCIPADPQSGEPSLVQVHWQHYWDCQPCSYPDRSGDLRSIIKIADFYSDRQWHSTGMYTDLYRPKGYEHELMLTLPAGPGAAAGTDRRVPGPGRTVRLFLFRGPGADFAEADRALLTLLRPHLHRAYLDAERRRQPRPALTPRQWQVLELLAAGLTNGQIARRLGVSEGTIRTHLENIYRRLEVTSRTAAVTRALGTAGPVA